MNWITKFISSTFSGYLSLFLTAFLTAAILYIIDTQLEIRSLTKKLEEEKKITTQCQSKVISERENYNFSIEKEVLENNIKAEKERNEQLQNMIKELEQNNQKIKEDSVRVSKSINDLKGSCLEEKIGKNSEVLNELFQ